jgi:hypothetical protein
MSLSPYDLVTLLILEISGAFGLCNMFELLPGSEVWISRFALFFFVGGCIMAMPRAKDKRI